MDLVLEGTVKGQYVRIHLDKAALRVGRSQDADIRLDDATVSRSHAILSVLDDHLELKDLGSHNGTFLKGRRLTDPAAVKPGDQIQLVCNPSRVAGAKACLAKELQVNGKAWPLAGGPGGPKGKQ